jgi:pimeloyl-ACP methyl ester carboxylesterase
MLTGLLLSIATPLPVVTPLLQHGIERPDGTTITYWLEDEDHQQAEAILVMQGTGCEPVSTKPNLRHAARLLRPHARALLIDKVGVGSDASGPPIEGCPQSYWDRYTLSNRVDDCLRVIANLRSQRWWNGRIILFGGSEGGAVAALLAPLVPETTAVIVLSSAIGAPVGDVIRSTVPPEMAAQASNVFAAAHAQPTGANRWAGLSYRWWDDAVATVPVRSLAQSPAPILLIHGALDQSSPVPIARVGYERLKRAGEINVVYREFPDYDHFMRGADGREHMDEVLADAGQWIEDATSRK